MQCHKKVCETNKLASSVDVIAKSDDITHIDKM